jgi:hypothetical protein
VQRDRQAGQSAADNGDVKFHGRMRNDVELNCVAPL